MKNTQSALLLCTSLSVVATAVAAHAQTVNSANGQSQVTELQQIVVKGKRAQAASAASDTPLATQTSAEQIRKNEIRNIRDLGNSSEPGVDYVESRPGLGGGTFIRGLGGARIATMIDDIPVPYLETQARTGSSSPATSISDGTNSFDFSALSSADVVRGADASRIGSGAMAGALVFKTLEAEDLIDADRDWGGIAKTGYDSQDNSYNASVAVAKRVEATSILFQAGLKRGDERKNKGSYDVYGASRTVSNPAEVTQNNLLFKLRHELSPSHRLGFTGERFFSQSDIDMRTLQDGTSYKVGQYSGIDDTKRERLSVDYQYAASDNDAAIDAASLTLYWQNLIKDAGAYATRFNAASPAGWRFDRLNYSGEKSVGVSGNIVSEFDFGSVKHALRIGGNANAFRYEEYISSLGGSSGPSNNDSQSDVPNIHGLRAGLYIEDEMSFAETGFSLTPGVRFDWHKYNPKDSAGFASNSGAAFGLPDANVGFRASPKLLAKYDVNESLGVFAQWAMTYRAPTVNELYSNFSNFGHGYARRGNDDLKAETGYGFEVGADYSDNEVTARVSAFHNRYSDFINAKTITNYQLPNGQVGQLFTQENLASVEISGVELRLAKEFASGFFAHGSVAYAYGKDTDTNIALRTIAPFKSIVGLGYAQEQWGTELTGIFASGMRDDNKATTFDAPGYGLFNLTGWWEPEQTKGLRLQAGIYNIFDKTYYNAVGVRDINPGSTTSTNQPVAFYSEPGRTFKISLTQKF